MLREAQGEKKVNLSLWSAERRKEPHGGRRVVVLGLGLLAGFVCGLC